RNRDFGIPAEPPQLLAALRVVAANKRRGLSDQLGPSVVLENRGGRPRRDLLPGRAPGRLTGGNVECGNERVLLDVTLGDDEVLPDDRRAADAPFVVRVVEPAGIQDAEVARPEQCAVDIVGV